MKIEDTNKSGMREMSPLEILQIPKGSGSIINSTIPIHLTTRKKWTNYLKDVNYQSSLKNKEII